MANVNTAAIERLILRAGENIVESDTLAWRAETDGLTGRDEWQDREEARYFLAGIMAVVELLGDAELEIPDDVTLWATPLTYYNTAKYRKSRGLPPLEGREA